MITYNLPALSTQVAVLRRQLLKLVGVKEFADEATFMVRLPLLPDCMSGAFGFLPCSTRRLLPRLHCLSSSACVSPRADPPAPHPSPHPRCTGPLPLAGAPGRHLPRLPGLHPPGRVPRRGGELMQGWAVVRLAAARVWGV